MESEKQAEDRFNEKFPNFRATCETEFGYSPYYVNQDEMLAFIHQERQLAKKEVLGEVLSITNHWKTDTYKESQLIDSIHLKIKDYAKQNNITLE